MLAAKELRGSHCEERQLRGAPCQTHPVLAGSSEAPHRRHLARSEVRVGGTALLEARRSGRRWRSQQ